MVAAGALSSSPNAPSSSPATASSQVVAPFPVRSSSSDSSVERIIYPDAFIIIHYMLNRFNGVMRDLLVHEENMARNMNKYGGIVFSQRVLLTLVDKGVSREEAYRLVQRNAHAAWNTEGESFLTK